MHKKDCSCLNMLFEKTRHIINTLNFKEFNRPDHASGTLSSIKYIDGKFL